MRSLLAAVPLALAVASCASRPATSPAVAPRTSALAPAPAPSPAAPAEPCVEAAPEAAAEAPPRAPEPRDDAPDPLGLRDGEPGVVDDGFEPPALDSATARPSPLDGVSDAELERKLSADPSSLGTISLGGIHSGALLYGVQMPAGPEWELMNPAHAWGARETVDALTAAIAKVNKEFPASPKLFIGDISRQGGGHFPPHVSHQSGRDVDLSYYLATGHRWYAIANEKNLDKPRTWALVRALVTESDLEMLLMDIRVQKVMKEYALEIGEDAAWLDDVFQYGNKSKRPVIFHVPGHASHLHARFYAPDSRELGRRAYPMLLKRKLIKPPTTFVQHTAVRGETLAQLAARYHTTADAIRRANGMGSSKLVRGRSYKIPKHGGVERPAGRLALPARRLPPARAAASAPASLTPVATTAAGAWACRPPGGVGTPPGRAASAP